MTCGYQGAELGERMFCSDITCTLVWAPCSKVKCLSLQPGDNMEKKMYHYSDHKIERFQVYMSNAGSRAAHIWTPNNVQQEAQAHSG